MGMFNDKPVETYIIPGEPCSTFKPCRIVHWNFHVPRDLVHGFIQLLRYFATPTPSYDMLREK